MGWCDFGNGLKLEVLQLDDPLRGQFNTDLDATLGHEIARGQRAPLARLWRSGYADGLSVSRRDVASDAGQRAQSTLEAQGLDMVVRPTGGTAVPQGEGAFSLSLILPRTAERTTTDAFFRLLCRPLVAWFQSLGVPDVATGELPGSFCDGKYNILIGERKIAGTAQAWRGGLAGLQSRHPGYVVAHACLMVDMDFPRVSTWINQFYALATDPYRVQPDTSLALRDVRPDLFVDMTPREATQHAIELFKDFLTTASLVAEG